MTPEPSNGHLPGQNSVGSLCDDTFQPHPSTANTGSRNEVSAQLTDLPPDYFTELTNNAAAAHVKRCSILHERPATWLIKKRDLALCPLTATILVKEGLLRQKDLELIPLIRRKARSHTDPLSAVAFGVYDTVGDILLGLVQGPVELGRQVTPMMSKYEAKQRSDANPHAQEMQKDDRKEMSGMTYAPHAAKQVAIGTGKGLGRIVGAGVKAPMTFTHGLTRGFHNTPKLYGEEVREYENVVDLRSGIVVSGKNFAYGLTDGLKDFFMKPIEGAQKDGFVGFGKGVGRGVGNLVCKPTAGAIGLIGHSSVGVYKEIQGLNFGRKDSATEVVIHIGEAEYEQASGTVRGDVVRKWCEVVRRGN